MPKIEEKNIIKKFDDRLIPTLMERAIAFHEREVPIQVNKNAMLVFLQENFIFDNKNDPNKIVDQIFSTLRKKKLLYNQRDFINELLGKTLRRDEK